MTTTTVIVNGAKTIGEGPHWDESTKCLLYVDIDEGGIHRWNPTTNQEESVNLDDTVGFVIPSSKGGYIIGLGRTIAHYDWDTKTITTMFETELKGTKNRFNDAKCDPSGRLWAGTMGYEVVAAHPEMNMGCLFSMGQDGNVKKWLEDISISNGLAWSSDHKTMYYIDSAPRKMYAFDYDINTGDIANQRTAIDFNDKTVEELGFPDGMCIDTEDKLWIAFFGVGKVIRYDPQTGKSLRELSFPAMRTTSCCFGGDNYDELYVTCANAKTEEERLKYPLAGSVFKVTGLGVKGTPGPVYQAN